MKLKDLEKYSLKISILALIVSIVSPFIIFHWLNDFELKKKYRAILHVNAFEFAIGPRQGDLEIEITNLGHESAQEVVIWLDPEIEGASLPDAIELTITPEGPVKQRKENGAYFIELGTNLDAEQKVSLSLKNIVKKEFSPSTIYRVFHSEGNAERYSKSIYYSIESGEGF
ncbi:hypothetical protein [Marinicella sp. W31]|uniref:hypothetical protein n=1 Tax=Marinicella sp. W31 TaxID=3023713 RepID=UPI003757D5EF